jgi:hypothetical protein
MASVRDDVFFSSPTVVSSSTTVASADALLHLSPAASRVSDGPSIDSEAMGEDPVETYFACITTCSLDDGDCITICTEQLRQSP